MTPGSISSISSISGRAAGSISPTSTALTAGTPLLRTPLRSAQVVRKSSLPTQVTSTNSLTFPPTPLKRFSVQKLSIQFLYITYFIAPEHFSVIIILFQHNLAEEEPERAALMAERLMELGATVVIKCLYALYYFVLNSNDIPRHGICPKFYTAGFSG